jgi:hypothetical protein
MNDIYQSGTTYSYICNLFRVFMFNKFKLLSWKVILLRFVIYGFAIEGFGLCTAWLGVKLKLTNDPGGVDVNDRYFQNVTFSDSQRHALLSDSAKLEGLKNLAYYKIITLGVLHPQVGGSIIEIKGKKYTFGLLAYEYYFSGEMSDLLPYPSMRKDIITAHK